ISDNLILSATNNGISLLNGNSNVTVINNCILNSAGAGINIHDGINFICNELENSSIKTLMKCSDRALVMDTSNETVVTSVPDSTLIPNSNIIINSNNIESNNIGLLLNP